MSFCTVISVKWLKKEVGYKLCLVASNAVAKLKAENKAWTLTKRSVQANSTALTYLVLFHFESLFKAV